MIPRDFDPRSNAERIQAAQDHIAPLDIAALTVWVPGCLRGLEHLLRPARPEDPDGSA